MSARSGEGAYCHEGEGEGKGRAVRVITRVSSPLTNKPQDVAFAKFVVSYPIP